MLFFFFNDTATTEIYTLSLHDALPILDDRNLDVYAVELGRRRDLFGAARYLKSGDFIRNESVRQYRTERIRLETEPNLPVNIDGEVVTRTPQDFSVSHNALRVLVPPESTSARQDLSG